MLKPVYDQRKITTTFRVSKVTPEEVLFQPIEQYYKWDDGTATHLATVRIFLNDKTRKGFGAMKIGDTKEFTLDAVVMTGLQVQPDNN